MPGGTNHVIGSSRLTQRRQGGCLVMRGSPSLDAATRACCSKRHVHRVSPGGASPEGGTQDLRGRSRDMLRWMIAWCLQFRLVMLGVAAALMLFGTIQLGGAPVDALPEFAPPYVEVQTEALGLSAPEVEELVTLNLEELLSGTPFLQSMHSTSVAGLSSIILVFEPGTDVIRARQLVAERLSLAVTIPNVAQPPTIIQPVSATNRVMMVGLSSRQISAIQMSVIARWTIRPALLSVPGVANVAIWGIRDRQLQVQVDPQRLAANRVTLDQIVSTTGNALWVSPLSFLN